MPKIESLGGSIHQQGAIHVEARGPVLGLARVNFENGNKLGNFGIIHRLSNISTLTVVQRPSEPGDNNNQ